MASENETIAEIAFGDKNDVLVREGFVQGETEDEAKARRGGQLSLAKILRPMWVDVIKNRQGGPGKIPFVFYPNYLLFRPGNHLAPKSEIAELRECLRVSSNAMEMVVQWLGRYPKWQDELKYLVAENRKALEGESNEKND